MDYRPVSTATQVETWPMTHMDAALSGLKGARIFAGIDFCYGYWQVPLQTESKTAHIFLTSNTGVQPTCTTQGVCNSAENFQAKVKPCFAELRDHLFALIDDLVLYETSEGEFLSVFDRFLDICTERNLVISIVKSKVHAKIIE